MLGYARLMMSSIAVSRNVERLQGVCVLCSCSKNLPSQFHGHKLSHGAPSPLPFVLAATTLSVSSLRCSESLHVASRYRNLGYVPARFFVREPPHNLKWGSRGC